LLLGVDSTDLEVFAVNFSSLHLVDPLGVLDDIVGQAQVQREECSAASRELEASAVVEHLLVVSYRSLRYAEPAASVVLMQKQLGLGVCFCCYYCHCRYCCHCFAAIHQRNHSRGAMVSVEEAQFVVVELLPAE
jgi:hypothetical protein